MSIDSPPAISIITPSFNRADELARLISSLDVQTLSPKHFELIISDDGSTDNTAEVVKRWKNKVRYELQYITQSNQGPGAARNHGMKEARGELLCFIDSDCEADPRWVETIYNEYRKSGFDACGGPDAAREDFSSLQKAIDFAMTSFFTTGGMRGHSSRPMATFYPRTHNMGLRKSLYERIGGFGDLRHGQDIEMSHRIRKSGAQVAYIPEAVVYHRRRTSLKQFFRQVFNWGVARVNLGKIDRDLLEPLYFMPSLAIILGVITLIGAIINPQIYLPIIWFGLGGLILFSIFGSIKINSVSSGLLLPIVVPIQIGGYGLGFLIAFLRRFILGKGVWAGFSKRYYR